MTVPRFSIGIDLGTTNSVLAFVPLDGEAKSEILAIPQWQTLSGVTDASVLEKTISVNRRDHSRPHRLAFGPPEQEASRFHGIAGQAGEAERKQAEPWHLQHVLQTPGTST